MHIEKLFCKILLLEAKCIESWPSKATGTEISENFVNANNCRKVVFSCSSFANFYRTLYVSHCIQMEKFSIYHFAASRNSANTLHQAAFSILVFLWFSHTVKQLACNMHFCLPRLYQQKVINDWEQRMDN